VAGLSSLQFSVSLEKGFKRGSIDYLWFNTVILFPLYLAAVAFRIYSLNGIYTFVLYYLIGKKHRNMIFFINIVPVRAPYLVWYLLFLNWVVRKLDITENIISIAVGHTFYYFTKVHPELPFSGSTNYLDTP
jgi:hypothetical protein